MKRICKAELDSNQDQIKSKCGIYSRWSSGYRPEDPVESRKYFPQIIWEHSQSEPIQLDANRVTRKDGPMSEITDAVWHPALRSGVSLKKPVWLYREYFYDLGESVESSDEAEVLIKHWLYKKDEKFKRMKSEIDAYEKFEKLEDELAKEHKREPIPQEVKMLVWKRDEGKCVECGSKRKLEFDHVIPYSKGGSNTARNIQLLCEKCNRSKSDSL